MYFHDWKSRSDLEFLDHLVLNVRSPWPPSCLPITSSIRYCGLLVAFGTLGHPSLAQNLCPRSATSIAAVLWAGSGYPSCSACPCTRPREETSKLLKRAQGCLGREPKVFRERSQAPSWCVLLPMKGVMEKSQRELSMHGVQGRKLSCPHHRVGTR